eukprot:4234657-Prymnesium_polylepis.1
MPRWRSPVPGPRGRGGPPSRPRTSHGPDPRVHARRLHNSNLTGHATAARVRPPRDLAARPAR